MILARPTKSLIRYVQMVGRVLRPAPGKARALLLDHSGTVLRLGFATDDLPLELDDGTANTSASKKQERKASEPKPCPSCKYVRPAGVHACPSCGFAPTRQSDVEVADGELVRLDRKTKKPATPDRKQHVYSQLLQVCRAKGYRPGWAANQYRAMFGVWPRGLREVEGIETALGCWKTLQANRKAHPMDQSSRLQHMDQQPAPRRSSTLPQGVEIQRGMTTTIHIAAPPAWRVFCIWCRPPAYMLC